MDSFIIRGGTRLKGKIEISGSKNSSLPIVAAALMTPDKVTLQGGPRPSHTASMLSRIGEPGCHVSRPEPKFKTVAEGGPDLNGPLDIQVTDEKNCEARYDIV